MIITRYISSSRPHERDLALTIKAKNVFSLRHSRKVENGICLIIMRKVEISHIRFPKL